MIENIDEIDYENMDDLPLSEHIEFNHLIIDEENSENEVIPLDWLYE